jgi:hypothetical protein
MGIGLQGFRVIEFRGEDLELEGSGEEFGEPFPVARLLDWRGMSRSGFVLFALR